MAMYTLVLVDTTGIQSYIFGSNRLRENVGASHLVYLATEGWLRDRPAELLGTDAHNLREGNIIDELRIEKGLDAELLYAGGGNTLLLFRNDDNNDTAAKRFTQNLSRKLLEEAPGLDVVAVRQPVNWDRSLAQALDVGFAEMKRRKAERERSQPLLGLGVTAACQSTGLVANWEAAEPGEAEQPLLVSAEVYAKWQNNIPAKVRLRNEFLASLPKTFDFPSDFDDLGRSKGDFSYLAVVHADGNGMGKRMEALTKKYLGQQGCTANRTYIQAVRKFSAAVNRAGQNALAAVVGKVAEWNQRGWLEPKTTYDPEQKRRVQALAIRPIVFGGDDVTFVCDGRIGLATAKIFLKTFGEQQIPTAEDKLEAGMAAAGVAIVKVHYPFARAYQLSEALCKNAKNTFARKASALDWHLAQSGLYGSLRELRRREYNERYNEDNGRLEYSLLMRPVTVNDSQFGGWSTWGNFTKLLDRFQDPEEWPRNKVIQLREALRLGPDAIGAFITNYRKELPDLQLAETQYRNTGWDNNRCVYFDAIEMIEQEVWP